MPTSIQHRTDKHFSLLVLFSVVIGCLTLAHETEKSQASPIDKYYEDLATLTLMDVEGVNAYLEERRSSFVEALAQSKLNSEQQELIANALTKVCVGLPVSSFTREFRQEEDVRSLVGDTSNWVILRDGQFFHQETMSIPIGPRWSCPFVDLPRVPFVAETGTLVEDSDTTSMFEFEFQAPKEDPSYNDVFSELIGKLNQTLLIRLDKVDQVPKYIALKLVKPVRKLFVYKINSYISEFRFSFIESCRCYAVSSSNRKMTGSARNARIRLLFGWRESTFSNVECEQPIRVLLPVAEEP